MARLKAEQLGGDERYIHLRIRKEDFEAFCSSVGLFKGSFLKLLGKSEHDLDEGRFTVRESLTELIPK